MKVVPYQQLCVLLRVVDGFDVCRNFLGIFFQTWITGCQQFADIYTYVQYPIARGMHQTFYRELIVDQRHEDVAAFGFQGFVQHQQAAVLGYWHQSSNRP